MATLRLCYADPPYLGCCGLYDHEHGVEGGCWDDVQTHAHLIDMLTNEFPDGWALSASSPSLREILPLCPSDVRVAAWVKPFCAFKRGSILAIECDGHDFHERTKKQAAKDRARDRFFQSQDIPLFRFTGSEIWADPLDCAHQAIRELERLSQGPKAVS